MSDRPTCPHCGSELPPGSPRNLCPRCLLREGLGGDAPDDSRDGAVSETSAHAPAGGRVLDTIAATIGPVPRVLLRDTVPGEEPSPLVKPSSPEMAGGPGRLQLFGEIARGGMGAILKGRDPNLGRDLAVKVLLERHRDNPDLVRRFVEEAQISGQLQHPGVVPVYELGQFGDARPYFSMKLVKGRTLAVVLHGRSDPRLDLTTHLATWLQVCQTVAYAHARGVVHRDLKPSNVMLGGFGEVQVMDWGLAKVLPRGRVVDDTSAGKPSAGETVITTARSGGSDSGLSRAGSVMGTPSYMAPEQARGEAELLDERCDVFALGSILCEVLTGKPAFLGRTSAEILRKAARGDLADATARLDASGADPELVALARDCLAPEPDDRPRDATVVTDRCRAYLGSLEQRMRTAELERAAESARAEEAGRRVAIERQRRHYQVGLAAAVLLLSVLGGLSFTYWLQQRRDREARDALALKEATLLRDQAVAAPGDVSRWEAALKGLEVEGRDQPGRAALLAGLTREVQAGLAAARRDRALLDAVAEVRSADVRSAEVDLGPSGTDSAYARAFREAGLDPDAAPAAAIGAALRARPSAVAVAAASALDDWALVRRKDRPGDGRWRRPLEAARSADPDPFRDKVRAALLVPAGGDRQETLRALAAAPDAAALPPASTVLLATSLPAEDAVTLLRAAVGRHPSDVWVNYELAAALDSLRPSSRQEVVRYYTAARSLRPETAHELAHVLDQIGRGDEALAVFADLVARRPADARNLGCYAILLTDRGGPGAGAVLESALAAGREAIRLKPHDADTLNNLGNVLQAHGKLDEAVDKYRAAIRLKPDRGEAHNNLGNARQIQGKLDEAVDEYRAAIRLKPDYAEAHNNLGLALKAQGKLDEAVDEHRAAIRLKPDDAKAHNNLGNARQAQGKLDEAVDEYRAAIRLKPDYAEAHNNLGLALKAQGKLDEAVDEYRAAIRLKPDYAKAHNNLGNALQAQGKLDEAVDEHRAATRLKPDLAEAHFNLGNALQAQGLGGRISRQMSDIHFNLGNALQAQGKVAEAVDEHRAAIRLKPDLAEAHNNLGLALQAQGKLDEAVDEYRAAIRLKPDDAMAHNNLGLALQAQGKLDEAVDEYRAAIRLKPDYAEAHYNLGNALQAQGKLDEAVDEYRAAIRLKPDLAEAHYNLGLALQAQGKLDEAVDEYRAAIRLKPDLAEAHCNLGRILQGQGDYAGSLAMYRKGHELGARQPGWRYPSAEWVAEAERLAALAYRLPALLKGEDQPKDVAERLSLAVMCHVAKRYAAAARFWGGAFEADPASANDLEAAYRYNAACGAALAGSGQSADDPPPDDDARARLAPRPVTGSAPTSGCT